MLLNGFENIYKVLLAILASFQEKLLKLSGYEILDFFNNLQSDQIIPQKLIQKALKTKVSKDAKENFEREYKSLPCPEPILLCNHKEINNKSHSPTITFQMVTEEPPMLLPRYKSVQGHDYRIIVNPFMIEKSFEIDDDSILEESFNAEDVLNNLVSENDWESLYKI